MKQLLWDDRITESMGVEKTSKNEEVQLLSIHQLVNSTMAQCHTQSFLEHQGDSTTSLGVDSFQHLTSQWSNFS